jgi:SAM-dependent methyltransferase
MYGPELAAVYDLIYCDMKDYGAEARLIAGLVRQHHPGAESILDVACGTGLHLADLRSSFVEVAGLEMAPAMLAAARARLPDVPLYEADMHTFDLGRRFDAVCCMFSAIGYSPDVAGLHAAVGRMAAHVNPGGVLIIEPWLTPDAWRGNSVHTNVVSDGDRRLLRMSHSSGDGRYSAMQMHYLVGDPDGVRYFTDEHVLTMFTQSEYEEAFAAAGCAVTLLPGGPAGRGLFLGTTPPARAA